MAALFVISLLHVMVITFALDIQLIFQVQVIHMIHYVVIGTGQGVSKKNKFWSCSYFSLSRLSLNSFLITNESIFISTQKIFVLYENKEEGF